MSAHTVFCSACDRNVVLVPHSADSIQTILLAKQVGEVACLDRRVRCTGALGPFCAVRPSERDIEEALPADSPRMY
jgi:hypothetical protein